jgi:hypothetical protein
MQDAQRDVQSSSSYFTLKILFQIIICIIGWEKGGVQGKKDYISIETGDSRHGKGRTN